MRKSHPLLNLLRKEGVKQRPVEEGVKSGVKDVGGKKKLKEVEERKIVKEELPSLTSIDYWDSRYLVTVHYSCEAVGYSQEIKDEFVRKLVEIKGVCYKPQ